MYSSPRTQPKEKRSIASVKGGCCWPLLLAVLLAPGWPPLLLVVADGLFLFDRGLAVVKGV
jgi:hypothetical protein